MLSTRLTVHNIRVVTLARIFGLALALIGIASYAAWLAVAGVGTPAMGWDFRAYYAAAGAITHGGNLYELATGAIPFYLYPPTLAALFTPLGALPLLQATAIWLVIQHVLLLLAGFLILRSALLVVGDKAWPGLGSVLAGLLIFLWGTGMPLREEIYLGQVNLLVLFLSLGGVYLSLSRSEDKTWIAPVAGLLLALAISIKVFPALLLILLLLRGRWRTVIWSLGLFLALQIGVGLLTVGPNGYSSTLDYWFSLFPDLPGRPGSYIDNQSLNGWLARLLLPATGQPAPDDYTVWRLLVFAASALVGLITVIAVRWSSSAGIFWAKTLRPARNTAPNWPIEAGLLFTTINIVSSISWTHHVIWWVLAALALVARWSTVPWQKRLPGYSVIALIAILLSVSATGWLQLASDSSFLPTYLFNGMHLFAMILLWLLLVRELLRPLPSTWAPA